MGDKRINIAVLVGKGSRLPAILKCIENLPDVKVEIVISYKRESSGVELAKEKGIEGLVMYWSGWKSEGKTREEFCAQVGRILTERGVNLVVMAGWDVILTKEYFEEFSGDTMNIHPSLLPAFAGLHGSKVQEEVLKSGIRETGATLHFVIDEGVDTGPIILQERVKVEDGETVESLEQKIHEKEDAMLCRAITLCAEGRLRKEGKNVTLGS